MKNKFYLDIQTDPAWANNEMGMPGDTLSMYGCLVTSLSNTKVLQKIAYTPKKLNTELRDKKGYAGLRNPELKENQSFILWNSDANGTGACDILGCKQSAGAFTYDEMKAAMNTGKIFFIARVIVSYRNAHGVLVDIGHYINILYQINGKYICFDTYDGKTNMLEENDITAKIKVDYS